MTVRAQPNHFELFGLPVRYAVDGDQLDAAYRQVQAQVHPDRFAHAGDTEKRVAMQWASRANEAYRVLRSPLKRAAYLCELHGMPLHTESNTAMPPDFLMQQMEWREALEGLRERRDEGALDALRDALRAAARALEAEVARSIDAAGDYARAAEQVRRWMFLDKFAVEIESVHERWQLA